MISPCNPFGRREKFCGLRHGAIARDSDKQSNGYRQQTALVVFAEILLNSLCQACPNGSPANDSFPSHNLAERFEI